MCNECDYTLLLENVLHVPGTQNNLILLGCWDAASGHYTGGGGAITLITKDGRHVAQGNKINNHLYKMKMAVKHQPFIHYKHLLDVNQLIVGRCGINDLVMLDILGCKNYWRRG